MTPYDVTSLSASLCPLEIAERVGQWEVSMAASGLSCRKALVGTRWPISILFGINGLGNKLSYLVRPPFQAFSYDGSAFALSEVRTALCSLSSTHFDAPSSTS